MAWHFDYYYPDKEKPEFMVSVITAGYQFTFYDKDGNEEKQLGFSIAAYIVEDRKMATGYQGRQGSAIENFRDFLFRFK